MSLVLYHTADALVLLKTGGKATTGLEDELPKMKVSSSEQGEDKIKDDHDEKNDRLSAFNIVMTQSKRWARLC